VQLDSALLEGYDGGPLIEQYVRTRRVLESGQGEAARLADTADELCHLYELIVADDVFWEVAGQAARETSSGDGMVLRKVVQLLGDLEQFCSKEVDLLVEAGFGERDAAELVDRLAVDLWFYRAGASVDVDDIKGRLADLKGAVCAIGPGLERDVRRRAGWLLLMRALQVAGCVVGAASVIPALSLVGVELVFAGHLLQLGPLLRSWTVGGSGG
jgi:hypothetical protein